MAGTTLCARAPEEARGLRLAPKLAPFVPSRGEDIRLRVSSDPVPEPVPPILDDEMAYFVADGSGFRSLPAKGLTFTLMANAHRVAREALNQMRASAWNSV